MNGERIEKLLKNATQRLQEIREYSGLKQKEFAEMFDIHPSTYNRYEKGGIEQMPKNIIEKICRKYSINPAWLLGYEKVEKHIRFEEVSKSMKRIPVLGTIIAGVPILANEDILGYEHVTDDNKVDFCLRIKGNSMIGARIFEGDIVFVRQQINVANGEIAVVVIDGKEVSLKRVYKEPNKIILRSENPTIPEMVFTAKQRKQIAVIGKVIFVKFEAR